MQRLLIIGKSFSGLTNYLKEHGYDYIVLKDVLEAKHPEKKLKHRVICDFSGKNQVTATVDTIKKQIDGVIAVYENYVLPASWVAEHLGLPGMHPEAAEACTDKWIMRQKFAAAPEKISPDFSVVATKEQLTDFANTHTFPLILKPANLAKSLLVTKNNSLEELLTNYQKTQEQIGRIYKKYAPNRQPKLLIEEFLEGSIHSVDAFIGNDGEPQVLEQIVDYQTGYDVGFADNFHYSRLLPSTLSPEDQHAFRHCAVVGIKALGMKNSPAHVEIIMTKQGPRIVEIGARNGGYRERMHSLANGLDIQKNAIKLALGEKPDLVASKDESVGVFELFPKIPGTFIRIDNEDKLRQLPSFSYLSIKAKPGSYIGKASAGFKMAAVVMLHNSDGKQFATDRKFLDEQVAVLTNTTD